MERLLASLLTLCFLLSAANQPAPPQEPEPEYTPVPPVETRVTSYSAKSRHKVTVLMYHHLVQTEAEVNGNSMVVTAQRFEDGPALAGGQRLHRRPAPGSGRGCPPAGEGGDDHSGRRLPQQLRAGLSHSAEAGDQGGDCRVICGELEIRRPPPTSPGTCAGRCPCPGWWSSARTPTGCTTWTSATALTLPAAPTASSG